MKKKIITILFIAGLSFFVSCSKEQVVADDNTPTKVTVDINVADLIPETKALKQNWEDGDKINIWFDGVSEPNYGYWKQTPHLVLTRSAGAWVSSEVDEGLLNASGTFDAVFESSNAMFGSAIDNTYAYFPSGTSFKITGHTYNTRTYQTPLVCIKNDIAYTYDSGTKKISGAISGWEFHTQIQVVVSGLTYTPDRYALTFDGDVNSVECMFYFNTDLSTSGTSECHGITDDSTNRWSEALMNSDGLAFYFKWASSTTARDYTIYLADKVDKKVYSYTKNAFINDTYSSCMGIKIAFSKFSQIGTIE